MLTKTLALEADTFHNPRQDGGSSSGSSSSRSGPYIRAISYAPGALDTDMQAESREGLPQIPLKAAFTNNAQQGRLVEPRDSARCVKLSNHVMLCGHACPACIHDDMSVCRSCQAVDAAFLLRFTCRHLFRYQPCAQPSSPVHMCGRKASTMPSPHTTSSFPVRA